MTYTNNGLYDVLVIGAGPAGLTASIYTSRYKLSNLVIGKLLGGTITWAHKVENFPGFTAISGAELGQKMGDQVKNLGVEIIGEEIGRVEMVQKGEGRFFKVFTESAKEFQARVLIIATGTERRKLGVPGEKESVGRGVSYCTTCDAPFFKDRVVALIGGANAACSGASHLAEYAKEIYLIYRKEELRAEPIWIEEVKNNPKIKVIYNTNVTEIVTNGQRVTGIKLDKPLGGKEILEVEGVFVEIGGIPASNFLIPMGVELGKDGYIKVSEKMETNIPGVFAAGDVTTHGLLMSQAIISSADGAIAAGYAYKYLKGQKAPKIIGV